MESSRANKSWINQEPLTTIDIGNVHFCLEHRSVEVGGKTVDFTAKEFDLFALLILNMRRVLTYEVITDLVWSDEYSFYSRKSINNHISNIKKKLNALSSEGVEIKSVHSVGYKMDYSIKTPSG